MSKTIIISVVSIIIIFSAYIPDIDAENVPSLVENTADSCTKAMHKILKDVSQDEKNQRCKQLLNSDYVFDRVNISAFPIHINSDGFRGYEITLEKPENTYRIFMVGGSTTYGDGIKNENTMPMFLQKEFTQVDLGFDVQVINAGIPKAFSYGEVKLIENRLLQYNPDLFVVYDGWNDTSYHKDGITDEQKWFDRWDEICNLGKEKGFDVIVTIQPIAGTGNRIITQQEYESHLEYDNEVLIAEIYPLYLEKLNMLNDCTTTADLTGIFDNVSEPVYYDHGHQGARGSEIIAKNMFKLIIPILTTNHQTIIDNIELSLTESSYKPNNLTAEDYISTMPKKLDWREQSYLYRNYSNQDLRNWILWDAENLKAYFSGSNLSNANLSEVDLSGWDFILAKMENADLSYTKLDNTRFLEVDLHNAKLEGSNFHNADLDVRAAKLSNVDLSNTDLSGFDFSAVSFSDSDLPNTSWNKALLLDTNLIGADLSGADFSSASLTGGVIELVDRPDGSKGWTGSPLWLDPQVAGEPGCSYYLECRNDVVNEFVAKYKSFVSAHFTNSTLVNTNLSNSILVGNTFNGVIAKNADFSNSFVLKLPFQNADLRNANFQYAFLSNVDFKNADLRNANFQDSFLSKIDFKNADLSGVDFTGVVIGPEVNFDDAILDCIGHPICTSAQVQVSTSESSEGGGCLIATTAFGSEMASQVQLLREIRDGKVMTTQSGTTFMTGFNQFYYSFSPAVADYEREHPVFKEAVKLTLTPLLASLTILNYVDVDTEEQMLGWGISLILLNIGIYFIAPAVVIAKIRKRLR